MKNYFAIRDDDLNFQELDLKLLDVLNNKPEKIAFDDVMKFHLKNTPMKSWWVTPNIDFLSLTNKKAPIPDISIWIRATLVLSPKAHRLLVDMLEPSGEFLPVTVGDETYYIFNCFSVGEVDEDKSSFEDNSAIPQKVLSQLIFNDNADKSTIFKTPLESCLTLYCGERLKEAVESFCLTGIIFDENLIEFYE